MASPHTGGWKVSLLGASTLLGKEVKAVLEERHLPLQRLQLVDTEDVEGQLTEFEGEPAILQPVRSETFQEKDLAIFACRPSFTLQHWRQAQESGCRIIDLSYFLGIEPRARHHAPLIEHLGESGTEGVDCRVNPGTIAVSAHPLSIALAGTLILLSQRAKVVRAAATLFEPASERGQAGVKELHQQTIGVLSFQKVPKKIFDAQLSFNLLSQNGAQSQPTLRQAQECVTEHLRVLLRGNAPQPAVRLLQAPVFHGYSFNLWVELAEPVGTVEIEAILDQTPFSLSPASADQPNVVSAAGSDSILLGTVERDAANEASFWIWGAFDNLRIAALNTARIAEQMMGLASDELPAHSGHAAGTPPLGS